MTTARWVGVVWLLVIPGIVLPFTLLSNVQAWYGSFLLWSVLGLAVIVLNVLATRHFGRPARPVEKGTHHE
ncbi:hypothetical protein [Kushneria phyllosphaerae]|uniref:Uncharacterized protein n=1 Tax=Kushneria phyllosphaerae TaxID=2100822 RepID=A0A2R8CGN6_9GAMM|nr:hypothetical protein [Kushneria phyllosphaerae]SPJ32059.1 hypothetical protein KSP9073_00059 [Kushneria phyllosphaerae]